MKAWQFDYDEENGYSTIIYAETRNKAKVKALAYADTFKYKDVRLKRVAWADKYGDFNNIPKVILQKVTVLENGWELPCECCGEMVMDGEYAEDKLPRIICNDCAIEADDWGSD